jgi:hypothetical protein
VRKVLRRHGSTEEAAERLPAVARPVDEEPRGGNRVDHGLVVRLEDTLRMGAVLEAALEGPLEDQ